MEGLPGIEGNVYIFFCLFNQKLKHKGENNINFIDFLYGIFILKSPNWLHDAE